MTQEHVVRECCIHSHGLSHSLIYGYRTLPRAHYGVLVLGLDDTLVNGILEIIPHLARTGHRLLHIRGHWIEPKRPTDRDDLLSRLHAGAAGMIPSGGEKGSRKVIDARVCRNLG